MLSGLHKPVAPGRVAYVAAVLGLGLWPGAQFAAGAPLDPPAPDLLTEARQIVADMIVDPRGPYSRIRWYCQDGTTQPPVPYACRERGGGRQHAEYSEKQQRLSTLGWNVGTIFAALTPGELRDSLPREQRLRELPLERYMIDIDNGWVLHRAMTYRGRVQVEDEEANGKLLLEDFLIDGDWASANYLLMRELVRTIPHGEETDLARSVRRAAIELAELEPAAENLRAEIHSTPSAKTAGRVRAWLSRQTRPEVIALGTQLADDLDQLYGVAGRLARLDAALGKLRGSGAAGQWRIDVLDALGLPARDRVTALCRALAVARSNVLPLSKPAARLRLLDTLQGLETEVQLSFQELPVATGYTRGDIIALNTALLDCAFGSGLLSSTEVAALSELPSQKNSWSLDDYRSYVLRQRRAPAWAVATIRHTFAEALIRYGALDARAVRFSDDLLRSSPMWAMGETLRLLSRDLAGLTGSVVEIAGADVSAAVALNSGIARGTLRILETIDAVEAAELTRSDVVVLPETIAELSPVAGILTLGEGNALSHVQLLARNFGIPNVAIDQGTVETLRPLAGREVLLVVDADGNVLLSEVDDAVRDAIEAAPEAAAAGVVVPLPDLELRRVLRLSEIDKSLSGRVVGPKAANLGELNRLFPGRVAPAVAIPFGVYEAHLEAAGFRSRITSAFARHTDGEIDDATLAAELAAVRAGIAELTLSTDIRDQVDMFLAEDFGEPGSFGVFVRSDTNVEDLPQFTGAGLNETVPNVVGFDAQLATIPRVWSSVLSPRSLAWRASVLANPERVYASVLVMKSVPATKSGVLVTTNLADRRRPGLTASTAWGVGGAVAGEAAESVVILPDRVEVLSEAKAPWRRRLNPSGGVEWVPADRGPVLTAPEIARLRELAAEVAGKYEPAVDDDGLPRPWDIEFGFVDGELTLFQIRPLVERKATTAGKLLRRLRPDTEDTMDGTMSVALDATPGGHRQ